jgi:hypothetical protein
MGWTSLCEDLQKRHEDALCHDTDENALCESRYMERLRAQVRNETGYLEKLLELATDPSMNVAAELLDLRDRYADCIEIVRKTSEQYSQLRSELRRARSAHKQAIKNLTKKEQLISNLSKNDLAYLRFVESSDRYNKDSRT